MLLGLQASGKSTYAKELIDKNPEIYKRVNKDELRLLLDNGKWSVKNEKFILIIRDKIIEEALFNGYNVIVDDTNFGDKHEKRLREIAQEFNAEFEVKEFNTPVWECLKRDASREKPVGAKVIWQTYNKYLAPKINEKKLEWVCEKGKKKAIICDIDGCIAHFKNRTPFDYSKVGDDYCDIFIKDIVLRYYNEGFDILFTSGREDICRQETLDWLSLNKLPNKYLFMRKTEDKRHDWEVKLEIYENNIKPNWSVFFCLDDRDQICQAWRSIGLKCLQVEFGSF